MIAVSADGHIAMPFRVTLMYRGLWDRVTSAQASGPTSREVRAGQPMRFISPEADATL